jgi:hypothetical protein
MLGQGNTATALSSATVDADFWALICQDEEWLNTEFAEAISDATETPTPPTRHLLTATAKDGRTRPGQWATSTTQPWRAGPPPGPCWRRERGPPMNGEPTAHNPERDSRGKVM